MKKTFHSKLAALFAIAALAFVGCGNPAGGGDNNHTGDGGGNGGGSSGGASGSSNTALTNTTWFFDDFDTVSTTCNGPHYQEPSSGTGGGSSGGSYPGTGGGSYDPGSGSGYQEPFVTGTNTSYGGSENKTASISKYYLHVDKDNNAFFGTATWSESYTLTWDIKTTTWNTGNSTTEKVNEKKTNVQKSSITYNPYARGWAIKNGDKIEFSFGYLHNLVKKDNSSSYDDDDDWPWYSINSYSRAGAIVDYNPVTGKYIDQDGKEVDPTDYLDDSSYSDPYNDYPYYGGDDNPTSGQTTPEVKKRADMYLTLYTKKKGDGLHYTQLLNDAGYVVATKSGSTLKLCYYEYNYSCTQKRQDGSTCGNPLSIKKYTIWTAATFDEEMLTANRIENEKSVENKTFIEKKTYAFGEKYNYKKFFKIGFKGGDSLEYWGNNVFWESKDIPGANSSCVVSEMNGKYYLSLENNEKLYNFTEPETGKTQEFKEFSYENQYVANDDEDFVAEDVVVLPFDNAVYESDIFKGNSFKYRKGYIADKTWAEQAATWKDSEGNKLECTGCDASRKITVEKAVTGMQEYTVTLDNKSSEIKNVVKAESGEKYYILLEDRCIILEDKKDESIIITDGDKTYTLKYDSRLGYKDDDFVEIDVTSEKTSTFDAFDHTESKYKLPKVMKISELIDLYKKSVTDVKFKKGYDFIAYKEKTGTPIANDAKIEDLNPKTIYLAYGKLSSSVTIKLDYTGDKYSIRKESENSYEPTTFDYSVSGNTITVLVGANTTFNELKTLFTKQEYGYEQPMYESDNLIQFKDSTGKIIGASKTIKEAGIKNDAVITVSDFDASTAIYKFKLSLEDSIASKFTWWEKSQYSYSDTPHYKMSDYKVAADGSYATFSIVGEAECSVPVRALETNSEADVSGYWIILFGNTVVYSSKTLFYDTASAKICDFDFASDDTVNELKFYIVKDYSELRTIMGKTEEQFPSYKICLKFDETTKSYYEDLFDERTTDSIKSDYSFYHNNTWDQEVDSVLGDKEFDICDKSNIYPNIVDDIYSGLDTIWAYLREDYNEKLNTEFDFDCNGKKFEFNQYSQKNLIVGTLDGLKKDNKDVITLTLKPETTQY